MPWTEITRPQYDCRYAISNESVMAAREKEGREASPAAGVIDSQSVKTTR